MRHCSCFLLCLLLVRPARCEEPVAKITKVEGDAVIQRDAELIRIDKDKEANVLPGDALRTRNGVVEIKYGNGSLLRIHKRTIVLFLSHLGATATAEGPEQKGDQKSKPEELRIRLVTGGITGAIQKGPWEKTVFLLPQSRVALVTGSVQAMASASGDWQVWLESGEAVATDLPMGLVWRVGPGQRFRVEYLPLGLRISLLPKSTGAATIEFYTDGFHEIVAERGGVELLLPEGKRVGIKEKQRVREKVVSERTRITGLDPSEAVVILRREKAPGSEGGPRPSGPARQPGIQKKTDGR